MKWLQTSAARCVNREEQEKKKPHAVCEVIGLNLQPKIVSCQKYIYVCKNKNCGRNSCVPGCLAHVLLFLLFKDKHTIIQHIVYCLTGDGRSTERL